MMTLRQLARQPESIPTATAWLLADLAEARGRQELYTKQSPQKLKALREHALIESAISSNRIEGVEIDRARIRPVILGRAALRDRDEIEVRGYRDALKLIHEQGPDLAVTPETIRELHRLARGGVGDAGQYREQPGEIVEILPDGRRRVRFKATKAGEVPDAVGELTESWGACLDERWVPPLVALAGFNLDFLCIHPFRDGNGRVSRLLLLLQCYHLGFEVGRYISLERTIEHNKDRYYETLEQCSAGWHQGKHTPWPYTNYLLYILMTAYREFEGRLGRVKAPRGAKTQQVLAAIQRLPNEFTLVQVEGACPGVSRDMIRKILGRLRADHKIECVGRGPGAVWRKRG